MQRFSLNRPRGFTLIELMITVAIIGILAAVALPSYSDYIRRGQLPEAFSTLATDRVTLEQYYQDNRNYGSGTTCAGGAIATTPTGTEYFSYGCVPNNSGQGYALTADSTSKMSSRHTYTLDQNNTKATTYFKGAAQTDKNCWLVKGSEC